MEKLQKYLLSPKLWISICIIIACIILWRFSKKGIEHFFIKENTKGRKATNTGVGLAILKALIFIIGIITILQVNDINVSSLVTGLGIIGIIVGFALQDILKDLLMGTYIIWDHFFMLGDVIKYGNIEGKVLSFNIKVTKLQDINTGNILTISNRNISQAEVLSDWQVILVPAPYDIPAVRMRDICRIICTEIEKIDLVTSCEFQGADQFDDSKINYRLLLHCPPEYHNPVRRKAYGVIQDVFAAHDIQIPYNQLDVHIN